ncbi:MBL fold metallo-hydrolase [Pseudobacteriovorax antillogorgiicola]|uniref:Glyoxylase, beta-lactamase superfamily II n=1 Tax=Pseudobacteriovorax antillogorgiicola TaxID=1513793 RepID=A0A1Y6BN20_9BACT|nr:MBL fold metallo-hydrolase [Pseudobacteriovorax antillogorgiicola]TCS54704.1 glyoxylase-like metal-dependent hydrolase (beta-lactamase superfamily II) [Pseudobacteriovorax antillogorgiicola]SMF16269.1 Glyoxylase, beta-lactamase superfamily II [Pseudobacteriovorax antillogorgiicola]
MKIQEFYDEATYTLTYVVYDEHSKDAVIIDPVLDFDPASGVVSFESTEILRKFIDKQSLQVKMVLETHAHADHLSSSHYLKEFYPQAVVAIGENIKLVQKTFKPIFSKPVDFPVDGSQFDRLLKDDELVEVGTLKFRVIFTPGHTPACASYLFEEKALFTGDALFMPDYGTGRCDFPAGSAKDLYNSVHNKIYTLDDKIEIYVGHDYQPGGRDLAFKTTVGEEKANNIQLKASTPENEFVTMRTERDKTLKAPRLLLPSVQVNIDAGQIPEQDEGKTYLNLPVSVRR